MCDCIQKTNEALAEHNTELDTGITIGCSGEQVSYDEAGCVVEKER